MNSTTFATDALKVNIGISTTSMVLLHNALTVPTMLTAAELTNLDSFPFVDADQDMKLMYSIKYATLVVQLSTMTTYLLNASLALQALPAVPLLMASFPSALVPQVTLLMLKTKYATSVPIKSTITPPLVNAAHAQIAHLDALLETEYSKFPEPPEASLGTLSTRFVIPVAQPTSTMILFN